MKAEQTERTLTQTREDVPKSVHIKLQGGADLQCRLTGRSRFSSGDHSERILLRHVVRALTKQLTHSHTRARPRAITSLPPAVARHRSGQGIGDSSGGSRLRTCTARPYYQSLLPSPTRLSLALESVRLDVRAVHRVRARLALGLLETHLDITPRREEAVDDDEREHRDGVEDVLSRSRQYVSGTAHTLNLMRARPFCIYLHPLVHVGVTVPALGELHLTIDGTDLGAQQ